MSGVVKSVGKVFRKVAEVGIKIAPYALAAGAIYFTAGAALGVPALAGGWGGAVSGLVSQLGAGSVLSGVLTGAITTAGYGAVAGGAMSLLTGGDLTKGMQTGALAGGVGGGIAGGLGAGLAAAPGAAAAPSAAASAGPGVATHAPTALTVAEGGGIGVLGGGAAAPSAAAGGVAAAGAGGAAAPAATGGGLFSAGGWLERNGALVGPVLTGLGQGYLSGAEADDTQKILLERDERQRQAIAENYGTGEVPGYRVAARNTGAPSPTQRFDPATYGSGPQWSYDAASGRMVRS